jgi:hypothetical protein
MKKELFQYCDSVLHIRKSRRVRTFEKLLDNYWAFREKNHGTLLFITSEIEETYNTIHKAIVTYMDCMDIMNIRKETDEIIIDCLIGNQEKIVIIIKKDYDIGNSVRSMRVDQVFIDCIDDSDIKVTSDIITNYLSPLTVHNNGKDLDKIILIY